MSGASDLHQQVCRRIAELSEKRPGSIGDQLHFRLVRSDPEQRLFWLHCTTQPWMCNAAGTLHGGMGATILDQAMGFIAHCCKSGPGTAPAIQLKVAYHRPLTPGTAVLVKVHLLSATASLLHLTAEAACEDTPQKLCLSGSGIYFYKPE